jgi:S-adenosylmethionine decarboxylase
MPKDAFDEPLAEPRPGRGVTVGPDFFIERDGQRYAGGHLLLDLWEASNLTDPAAVDAALREAAVAAGATILHSHIHQFGEGGGVSGVVMLAESHISIHTWPERAFAAIDVFMCGACDPERSVPVIERAFRPARLECSEHRRGLLG